MSKTVLVTGANGQLGREMQRVAQKCENNYIFTDIAELDITKIDAIRELFAKSQIDVIVNCAAYTNVDKAEQEQGISNLINNEAAKNLAIVAKENSALLIHISTDYVFDGSAHTPYTEQAPTKPIGVYGATKLAGEQSIINSTCRHIIIRTSWLYSLWGSNFVKTMQQLTSQRDSLNVIFDQIGTPTHAGDLADAIGKILSKDSIDQNGVYHFSNEGVCSWYDFAIEIAHLSGNSCEISPIHSWEYPSAVTRPHYSVLDKTKFKTDFELTIAHWKSSLSRCINQLKNQ